MANHLGSKTPERTTSMRERTRLREEESEHANKLYSVAGSAGHGDRVETSWWMLGNNGNQKDAFPGTAKTVDEDSDTLGGYEAAFHRSIDPGSDRRSEEAPAIPNSLRSERPQRKRSLVQHIKENTQLHYRKRAASSAGKWPTPDARHERDFHLLRSPSVAVHSSFDKQSLYWEPLGHSFESHEASAETIDSGYHSNCTSWNSQTSRRRIDEALTDRNASWLAPADEAPPRFPVAQNDSQILSYEPPEPFTCSICWQTFHLQIDLRRHERTHEKVHRCAQCQKSFTCREDLLKHEVTHSTYRPHKCPVSDCRYYVEGFPRFDNLERHIRAQHTLPDCRKTLDAATSDEDVQRSSPRRPRSSRRSAPRTPSSRQSQMNTFAENQLTNSGFTMPNWGSNSFQAKNGEDYDAIAEGRASKRRKILIESNSPETGEIECNQPLVALENPPHVVPDSIGSITWCIDNPVEARHRTLESTELDSLVSQGVMACHRVSENANDSLENPLPASKSDDDELNTLSMSSPQISVMPSDDLQSDPDEKIHGREFRVQNLLATINDLTAWTEDLAVKIAEKSPISYGSTSDDDDDEIESTSLSAKGSDQPTDDGDGEKKDEIEGPAEHNFSGISGLSGTSERPAGTSQNKAHDGTPQVDIHPSQSERFVQVIACICKKCKGKDADISNMREGLTTLTHKFWYCDSCNYGFAAKEKLGEHNRERGEDHLDKLSARWRRMTPHERYASLAAAFKKTYPEEDVYTEIQYVNPEPGDIPTRSHGQGEPMRRKRDTKRKRLADELDEYRKQLREARAELSEILRERERERAAKATLRKKLTEAEASILRLEGRLQGYKEACRTMTSGSTTSSVPPPNTPQSNFVDQPWQHNREHFIAGPYSGTYDGEIVDPPSLDFWQQQGFWDFAGLRGFGSATNTKLGLHQQLANQPPVCTRASLQQSIQPPLDSAQMSNLLAGMEFPVFNTFSAAGCALTADVTGGPSHAPVQQPISGATYPSLMLTDSNAAHNPHDAMADFGVSVDSDLTKPGVCTDGLQMPTGQEGTSAPPYHGNDGMNVGHPDMPDAQQGTSCPPWFAIGETGVSHLGMPGAQF